MPLGRVKEQVADEGLGDEMAEGSLLEFVGQTDYCGCGCGDGH